MLYDLILLALVCEKTVGDCISKLFSSVLAAHILSQSPRRNDCT